MNNRIIYSINVEDIITVSEDINIPFKETDIDFIQQKVEDYLGSIWQDAIDFALNELQNSKEKNVA